MSDFIATKLRRLDGKLLSTFEPIERRLHILGGGALIVDWRNIGPRKWIVNSRFVFTEVEARILFRELGLHLGGKRTRRAPSRKTGRSKPVKLMTWGDDTLAGHIEGCRDDDGLCLRRVFAGRVTDDMRLNQRGVRRLDDLLDAEFRK